MYTEKYLINKPAFQIAFILPFAFEITWHIKPLIKKKDSTVSDIGVEWLTFRFTIGFLKPVHFGNTKLNKKLSYEDWIRINSGC